MLGSSLLEEGLTCGCFKTQNIACSCHVFILRTVRVAFLQGPRKVAQVKRRRTFGSVQGDADAQVLVRLQGDQEEGEAVEAVSVSATAAAGEDQECGQQHPFRYERTVG